MNIPIHSSSTYTMDDKVAAVHGIAHFVPLLYTDVSIPDRILLLAKMLQNLRHSCSIGPEIRRALASSDDLSCLHDLFTLPDSEFRQPAKFGWQMLVNCCYDDVVSKRLVWGHHQQTILAVLDDPSNPHAELCRMVVHTLLVHDILNAEDTKAVLKLLIAQYRDECDRKSETLPEHLQFSLEYFGCRRRGFLPLYGSLTDHERVAFLQFIGDYVRGSPGDTDTSTEPLSKDLVQYLCKEFKKKSDCVLKTAASYADSIHPREVYALLEVISALSGDSVHAALLAADSSLFLNVGCLLAAITSLGQKSENVFTPISKLGQIAPNSSEDATIERDISYDLKTMLVRTIANLAHRNAKNQELAREMDILLAVLNCTSVDARNPLIKEWSVLAIRNLCDGCPENQAIVRGLMKVGDADNSEVLKEFNLEMGSMRIAGKPN